MYENLGGDTAPLPTPYAPSAWLRTSFMDSPLRKSSALKIFF